MGGVKGNGHARLMMDVGSVGRPGEEGPGPFLLPGRHKKTFR